MIKVTVLTPVSPDHLDRLPLAQAAVAVQTVPVVHLHQVDEDRRGPGWVRNRLLEQVTTEYVTFLDADDWMAPQFAEWTLATIRPHRYVYTDWWRGDAQVAVRKHPWCMGSFHLITALVRTADARTVGGFDEALPGMEDTDFFLKLLQAGICGLHLKHPLVGYRPGGGRAARLHQTGEIDRIKALIDERYGGKRMSCCGDPDPQPNLPLGDAQPGDILAQAQWGGNHVAVGRATGRRYPRMSYPKVTWVDPRDVEMAPADWHPAPPELEGAPTRPPFDGRGVAALAEALTDRGIFRPPTPVVPLREPGEPGLRIPAIRKVRRLAGALTLPVFVAPRKDYPSFRDFWRLVELAGFAIRYADEIDLEDAQATYIFATPGDLPDCTGARARTLFWELEYTGDYAAHANQDTVDAIWSSDPAHARASGARYVLLGSHRGLNPSAERLEPVHDVTMLAYLTERRERVKARLANAAWPPDYPGHAGSDERHQVLRSTRLMLHVHQYDTPALAPLRLAIAAAYRLPVISEDVPDRGPYAEAVLFARYDNLPQMVHLWLGGKLGSDWEGIASSSGDRLHALLCQERPFGVAVLDALAEEVPA